MTISDFRGPKYDFLSNFFQGPTFIWLEGNAYPTVEHAFQAAKTFNALERIAIERAETASHAKALGQKATLRPDWEEVKLEIMRGLISQKFSPDPLAVWLLKTGDEELIEGNWWHDNYWGVCRCSNHAEPGQNHLGKLLMAFRTQLRKTSD